MNYVLTENGNIKIGSNGKPLVVDDDEKEFEIDAISAQSKITKLVEESNGRRKKLGEANNKLKAFEGIEDPAAALKAIQDVAGMDDKSKADLKAQRDSINKTWEEKENEWNTEKTALGTQLFDATVGVNFATSKVIKNTVLPPDIAKATFGKHFNQDGTANDASGNIIYSKENPGEPAKFDEAISVILDNYPDKDNIMKSSGGGGGGGHVGGDGGGGGGTVSSTEKIAAGLKLL